MPFSLGIKSAARGRLRAAAAWLIGRGAPVPEIPLARLPEYARLRKLLREHEINCVIDVGANRGQFGLMLRRFGYRGDIHSFEPLLTSYQVLTKQAAQDPRWHCHQLALGEAEGQYSLRANQKISEMTSFYPLNREYGPVKTELVQVKRLDALSELILDGMEAPRVFLKIDTEGHDLAVVRGAGGILSSVQVLQVEVFVRPVYQGAPHYLEVLGEIEAAQFVLEHLAVVSMTNNGNLMCLNALFSRSA